MSQHWFVRQKIAEPSELAELRPLTFDEFLEVWRTGKLAATDLVKEPGKSEWRQAATIKGLFRDHNDARFATAKKQMDIGDVPAFHEAVITLSEIIRDQASSSQDESRAFLMRGECQQWLGLKAADLTEVLALFESAQTDFSQSVNIDKLEHSWKMTRKSQWFPQHSMYLPAYRVFLQQFSPEKYDDQDSLAIGEAARALSGMGREATDLIPELKAALPCAGVIIRHQVEAAIKRISRPPRSEATDELQALFDFVEDQLQIYPTRQDRFDLEHPLTEEDLKRSESELVAILDDKEWAVRAKSACILRCKVQKPKAETIRALFDHLDPKEKRGNVRGQCALTLAHFASEGAIQGEILDRLITVLRELLDGDPAYAVQAIAAEALADIAPHLHEVVASLISALSKSKVNVNLERALVRALGKCGQDAEAALPSILRFTPHRDDATGFIVKAAAIVGVVSADHPEGRKSLKTIIRNLRWQPIGKRTGNPRDCRDAALKAIRYVPIDEQLRKKLLLERMFFDESAKLRCKAARSLIAIDKDLATKAAGAFLVVDRIGCG